MDERRTFASVTTAPCGCGYLDRAADDPAVPIAFDGRAGEFQFRYGEPGGDGPSSLILYHCPFCGGAAPPSRRHLLFAVIPRDEEDRLADLLRPVKTLRSAIRRLGTPDRDDPAGTRVTTPESAASPPTTRHHRTLTYDRLSDVATVRIRERPDGRAAWDLSGKPINRINQPR